MSPNASTARNLAQPVAVIDDPDGAMRLVAVRGRFDALALEALAGVLGELRAGQGVHLDMTDAVIDSATVLAVFERLIDRLECEYVAVRIVGIDPTFPAIADLDR